MRFLQTSPLSPPQRRIVLAVLAALILFYEAALSPHGFGVSGEGAMPLLDWHYVWTGGFFALLGLLGAWAGLRCQPASVRVPPALAMAASLGLVDAWISFHVSLARADHLVSSVLSPILLFLVFFAAVTLVRRFFSWRIMVWGDRDSASWAAGTQYTVRDLLVWTAEAAVFFAIAEWILHAGAPAGPGLKAADLLKTTAKVLLSAVIVSVLCLPIVIPTIGLVLADHNRRRFAVWTAAMVSLIAIAFFLLHVVMYLATSSPFSWQEGWQATATVVSVLLGFVGVTMGTLAVARFCGYRLIRSREPAGVSGRGATGDASDIPDSAWPSVVAETGSRWPFRVLIALLILLGLALCWPAARVQEKRREMAAVGRVHQEWSRVGASVWIDKDHTLQVMFRANEPVPEALLEKLNEPGTATAIKVLDLSGSKVTDVQLKALRGLGDLERLFLNGTPVTDAGLAHLAGLPSLMEISLSNTSVTDAGLQYLHSLPALTTISLDGTRITDAGLSDLTNMKGLTMANLSRTQVTAQGVAKFRQAAPDCQVIGAPPPPTRMN